MSLLPSFARMTIWFIPWADPLLQAVLELPPEAAGGEEAPRPRQSEECAPARRKAYAR